MKYHKGKIKKEHNILEEFKKFLNEIQNIKEIKRIIPWRINRKQKWSSDTRLHFSYNTHTGLKYKMSKGWTSQELFIICPQNNQDVVKDKIRTQKEKFNF